jgi:hypothetical protein
MESRVENGYYYQVGERVKRICILLLNLLRWSGGLLLRVSHTHLYSTYIQHGLLPYKEAQSS